MPAKRISNAAAFLRQKCLFTLHQVTSILRDSPAIVMENTNDLEYKFQVSVQNRHLQILYRFSDNMSKFFQFIHYNNFE